MLKENKFPIKDILTISTIGALGYFLITHPQMSKKEGAAGGGGNGEKEKESITDVIVDELGGLGVTTPSFNIHIPGTTTETGTDYGFLDFLAGLEMFGKNDSSQTIPTPTPTPTPKPEPFELPKLPSLTDIITTVGDRLPIGQVIELDSGYKYVATVHGPIPVVSEKHKLWVEKNIIPHITKVINKKNIKEIIDEPMKYTLFGQLKEFIPKKKEKLAITSTSKIGVTTSLFSKFGLSKNIFSLAGKVITPKVTSIPNISKKSTARSRYHDTLRHKTFTKFKPIKF